MIALTTLSACDEPIVAPPTPRVRSVEVFPNPATVRVDEDLVMVMKVAADSGADMTVNWRSSDPRRVSITQTGIMRGLSVGPAVVTVQSKDDPSISVAVPVNVMPKYTGVTSISVSPAVIALIPGQTQPVAATMVVDPGISRAVSYTVDKPAIATVSAEGLVTAVSVGTASLTVRSRADTSVLATVPITVRAPTGARVSIQAITSQRTNQPVDLLNTQGQVDVLINLEPGEARLSRLDLVVNSNGRDTVVASQSFTASQATAAFATGVQGNVSAATIVQSFRTDAFDASTGRVFFTNGPATIKAIAVDVTPTGTTQQSATSSIAAVLNNPDGFVMQVRPLSSTATTSALDRAGRRWIQAGRGLAITTTPVLFSRRLLGSRTITFPGTSSTGASVLSTASGVSVDTLRLPPNYVGPTTGIGYANGELPAVTASDAGGNPMTLVPALASGEGAGILNLQPTFTTGIRLEGLRIDNAPPPRLTLALTSTRGNTNNWINGEYVFADGLDSLSADIGVGLRGTLATPTPASAEVAFLAVGGSLTDTTEVVNGAGLAPTTSNLAYKLLVRYADRLGNTQTDSMIGRGAHPGTRFGVDNTPPTIRYATTLVAGRTLVTANSDSVFASNASGAGRRVFGVEAIDDVSGLPSGRVAVTLRRFAQPNRANDYTGTYTCLIGTGASCEPVFRSYETLLSDDYRQMSVLVDDSTGVDGYYHFSATVQDQAGNVSGTIRKRILIDAGTGAAAPSISGLGVSGVFTGNEPAAFIALASDNVELRSGGLLLRYPTLPGETQLLAYGTPNGGAISLGTAFDSLLTSPIAGTHPAFTVPRFIRTMELVDSLDRPPTSAAANAKPNAATAWVTDFAVGGSPASLATEAPIVAGAVQSPSRAPVFAGNSGTANELTTWARAGSSGLRFDAVGPSGQIAPPFTRVIIARLEDTALTGTPRAWRVVGELTSPSGSDNGLRRVWSWNFGFLGSGQYVAIGVNAAGDGLISRVVSQ
jgi:hypothetical protein